MSFATCPYCNRRRPELNRSDQMPHGLPHCIHCYFAWCTLRDELAKHGLVI